MQQMAGLTESASEYQYKALLADGREHQGRVRARTRHQAADALCARGLFPVHIEPVVYTAPSRAGHTAHVAAGLHMLASLLGSGLSLSQTLQVLSDIAPPGWERALESIDSCVKEGLTFTEALGESKLAIPSVVIGIISAGEKGGELGPAIRRSAELLDKQDAARNAVISALAYPALLAAAGLASSGVLVGIVLPRFSAILLDLGQSLPVSTRLVLAVAETSRVIALPSLAALMLLLVVGRRWTGTPEGRRKWHQILLTLPVIGPLRMSMGTSRLAATLASLLESGVPIAPALSGAALASGDSAITARVQWAREGVLRGRPLSAAVREVRGMSAPSIRLVRAGEESGQLAPMLRRAAAMEDELVDRRLKAAVRMLEPILVLFFGALVALVAASLLQAVYSVRPIQ